MRALYASKSRVFGMVSLFLLGTFFTGYAFADSSVVTPEDFFKQIMDAVASFGGGSWVLKVGLIVNIVIASMKVSFLNDLVWKKLGQFQAWLAPILGLVGGVLGLAMSGQPVTLSSVFAYLAAGAGAIILHELLDTIKAIPGLGSLYVGLIDTIEKLLGGPASQELPIVPVAKK